MTSDHNATIKPNSPGSCLSRLWLSNLCLFTILIKALPAPVCACEKWLSAQYLAITRMCECVCFCVCVCVCFFHKDALNTLLYAGLVSIHSQGVFVFIFTDYPFVFLAAPIVWWPCCRIHFSASFVFMNANNFPGWCTGGSQSYAMPLPTPTGLNPLFYCPPLIWSGSDLTAPTQ